MFPPTTKLPHLCPYPHPRVLFGSSHLYVFHHPKELAQLAKEGRAPKPVTYDFAQEEIAQEKGFDMSTKGKSIGSYVNTLCAHVCVCSVWVELYVCMYIYYIRTYMLTYVYKMLHTCICTHAFMPNLIVAWSRPQRTSSCRMTWCISCQWYRRPMPLQRSSARQSRSSSF